VQAFVKPVQLFTTMSVVIGRGAALFNVGLFLYLC
jgi:hypothetical protein